MAGSECPSTSPETSLPSRRIDLLSGAFYGYGNSLGNLEHSNGARLSTLRWPSSRPVTRLDAAELLILSYLRDSFVSHSCQ